MLIRVPILTLSTDKKTRFRNIGRNSTEDCMSLILLNTMWFYELITITKQSFPFKFTRDI